MANSDETVPSSGELSWRDAMFYEDIVAAELNLTPDKFRILMVTSSPASKEPDGYMSLLYRVTVSVQVNGDEESSPRELRFIAKVESDGYFGSEVQNLMQTFPKEIEMYSKIIPAFEQLWAGDKVKFGPRSFKSVGKPNGSVIIMEDLREAGYLMKPCADGMTLGECRIVLEKLARFHAASVAYYEKNGAYTDPFKDGMYADCLIEEFSSYYAPLYESFLKRVRSMKIDPDCLEALENLNGKLFTKIVDLFRLDPKGFNVLNHGDLWVNNILFNKEDILLLDYQISFYGSPAFDLIYFMINSAALDVRTESFNELIDYYQQELSDSLKKLGTNTNPPTKEQLHKDIRKRGLLACAQTMEALCLILTKQDLKMDANLLGSDQPEGIDYRNKLYDHPRVTAALERLIPFLWKEGFITEN
ncbi:uncharacterized protein LOC129756354 [Uranotaenia lowii]|uniref:uncharacterized protein LOC129756216 n=1 Tax=Uranotaenia lowii TaxID=190385 RepID=UPI00247B0F69|nr:uncharacterized protein LOC129756216 [Uranotaenia lowii]XP_055609186.1 uncharacterized protein LOC129756354 [Uranotaenia lowii]